MRAVFDKAMRFADAADADVAGRGGGVVYAVVLDEVGLAELSPHNPLKVRVVGELANAAFFLTLKVGAAQHA